MISLPDVEHITHIRNDEWFDLYKGFHTQKQKWFIYKTLSSNLKQPRIKKKLTKEFHFGKLLNETKSTLHTTDLLNINDLPVLEIEHFDGYPLSHEQKIPDNTFETKLKIAILLCKAIKEIHAQNVILCNLAPQNTLYNPLANQVRIGDLSQAIHFSAASGRDMGLLQKSNLPYISPEQTGRLNKTIDHRSDFYSFGSCLYWMFTGYQPFYANDPSGFFHQHIAIAPPPAKEKNSTVPDTISRVIEKLMAKMPEDRYQSCRGILNDLLQCQPNSLSSGTRNIRFEPGNKDTSELFVVSQKLYGRETETESLLNEFNSVINNESKLVFVGGTSGIGKSSLVNSLREPVLRQHGYFISGKFNHNPSDIPYYPLITAIQELVSQILAEGDNSISSWQKHIKENFGQKVGYLTTIVPDIQLITGESHVISNEALTNDEAGFRNILSSFILSCSFNSRPLVLFLDDLQWADLATLKFLENLLTKSTSTGILIIGTYRTNEVEDTHPLQITISKFQRTGHNLPVILLGPIGLPAIEQLIGDTLFRTRKSVQSLALLCQKKTDGNPFFLQQFLYRAFSEKQIFYSPNQGSWQWNKQSIAALEITENLIIDHQTRFKDLNAVDEKILKMASCLGPTFDLETLQLVAGLSEDDVLGSVEKLSDFIICVDTIPSVSDSTQNSDSLVSRYKFSHDQLHKAAYSLLDKEEVKKHHHTIGTKLKETTDSNTNFSKIFDVAGHLNLGSDLLSTSREREELLRLNFRAGQKAQLSSAHLSAHNYLQAAVSLLSPSYWKDDYTLALSLHSRAAEAAFMSKNFQTAEFHFNEVIKHARNELDKAHVYSTQIRSLKAQNLSSEAVKTGLDILDRLGIKLPKRPSKVQALSAFLRAHFLISSSSYEEMATLPTMTDPKASAIIRLLFDIGTSAYYSTPGLVPYVAFNAIRLSLKYGVNYESITMGFATHGFLECGLPVGSIEKGIHVG